MANQVACAISQTRNRWNVGMVWDGKPLGRCWHRYGNNAVDQKRCKIWGWLRLLSRQMHNCFAAIQPKIREPCNTKPAKRFSCWAMTISLLGPPQPSWLIVFLQSLWIICIVTPKPCDCQARWKQAKHHKQYLFNHNIFSGNGSGDFWIINSTNIFLVTNKEASDSYLWNGNGILQINNSKCLETETVICRKMLS